MDGSTLICASKSNELLQLRKNLAQALVEHQVRVAVVGCRVPVDEDQPVAPVVADQARRRVDRQAGAAHDQQVSVEHGKIGRAHV